jgi:hypothetical protein
MAEIVVKLVNGELAGKTAQSITKEVNAASLAFKKATVGTKEWLDAQSKLEKAKTLQSDYTKQVEATTKASTALKANFGGLLNQIPGFSQLSGMFGQLKGGVGGLTSASQLLKVAMMAIPIFLLIGAVTALIGWFTKTEKGANVVSGAFKAMGAIIDTLMNRLWNIGDTLKQLFSDPIAFFKNLGKDIKDAAVNGYDLVQVFDDIEDRQRALDVKAKEQDNMIDKLLLSAKNVGKTYDDKLKILAVADQATRDSYKEQLKLSQEYLDAVEKEVIADLKQQGFAVDTTKDLLLQDALRGELADKLRDARLKNLDLIGQEQTVEQKIANFREKIFDKQDKELDKINAKKEKELEKELKDREDSLRKLEDLRVQAITNAEQEELAATELKFQREVESLTLHGDEKKEAEKLIAEVKAQELNAIVSKYEDQREAEHKKHLDKLHADSEKWAEEQVRLEQERADLEKNIRDVEEGNFRAGAHLIADLMAKELGDTKAAKVVKKAAAIVDIGIALAKERAYNAVAAAQYAATFPPPLGIAAGAAYLLKSNIASTIRAGISIARVIAFKKGGYTGPGAVDQPAGVVHAGEVVFSQADVAALGGVAAVEKIRPTAPRGYSTGGPVSPYTSNNRPAISSGNAGSSSNSLLDEVSDLKNTFLVYAEKVDHWVSVLKVHNDVRDTEAALKLLNDIRDDADM